MTQATRRRMVGRDPHEPGRVATPLELLYDLCFAVAFGIAGSQFAHYFSEHSYGIALTGFAFAVFAICWTWIQFSWFASAFDPDDWLYRVTVMVQMVGVVVVALGLPVAFHSMHEGHGLDIRVMVSGYVVIRLAQLANWFRLYLQAPEYRSACIRNIAAVLVSQALWLALAFAHLDLATMAWLLPILIVLETTGPIIGEGRGEGTPWHSHHITERFSLLAIITLGEGVIGTVASVNAAQAGVKWTWEPVVLIVSGLLLVFGMWWVYFIVPWAEVIVERPRSRFVFSYGHILVLGTIAGTGATLHIAGYTLEGAEHHVSAEIAATVVAATVGCYLIVLHLLYSVASRSHDRIHSLLTLGSVLVAILGVVIVRAGTELPWGILIISLAPLVTVIGTETRRRSTTAVNH